MEFHNKRYKMVKNIGEGVHGVVYEVEDVQLGQFVAVKKLVPHLTRITFQSRNVCKMPPEVFRELEILQRLKPHPNVIRYLGSFKDDFNHFMVLELMHCSLLDMLRSRGYVFDNKAVVKVFIKMLLQGVAFLHDNHIMHRVSLI